MHPLVQELPEVLEVELEQPIHQERQVDLQLNPLNQEILELMALDMLVEQVVIHQTVHQVVVAELELLEANNQVVVKVETVEMEKILLQSLVQVLILTVVFTLVVAAVEQ